jgi:hypothetical protein
LGVTTVEQEHNKIQRIQALRAIHVTANVYASIVLSMRPRGLQPKLLARLLDARDGDSGEAPRSRPRPNYGLARRTSTRCSR